MRWPWAKTRHRKCQDASMGELRQLWLARLDDGDRQALAALAAMPGSPTPAVTLGQAIESAIAQCFAKGHALVPEKRLVAAALAEGLGTLTTDEIRRRLPAHGIVFRDYDGQRFCARVDHDPDWQATAPEHGLSTWEQERRDFYRQSQQRASHGHGRAYTPQQPGWTHGR